MGTYLFKDIILLCLGVVFDGVPDVPGIPEIEGVPVRVAVKIRPAVSNGKFERVSGFQGCYRICFEIGECRYICAKHTQNGA